MNDETLKSDISKIKVNIFDKTYTFLTDNGVFSKERLDYGTRLLLENLDIAKMEGAVLDLGCGYGAIGIILGSINKNIFIDMVDVNERALFLSRENIKLNSVKNLSVYESDGYKNINNEYNYIVTNPPIRVGKEKLREILIGAKEYLKKDGELWFVMRKDHGAKTFQKELEKYYRIDILEKSKGFYIFRCFLHWLFAFYLIVL